MAGSHGIASLLLASRDGIRRLQTLAATIMPAANPREILWNAGLDSFPVKRTDAAPSVVIRKQNPVPSAAIWSTSEKSDITVL